MAEFIRRKYRFSSSRLKTQKRGFRFIEDLVDWLKVKITFWKKENYVKSSEWVEQRKRTEILLKINYKQVC